MYVNIAYQKHLLYADIISRTCENHFIFEGSIIRSKKTLGIHDKGFSPLLTSDKHQSIAHIILQPNTYLTLFINIL